MDESPNCDRCQLSETAESICLKGRGSLDAPLLILFDAPNVVEEKRGKSFVGDAAEYLIHLMNRMSIPITEYYLEYVLKCYPKKCKAFGRKAERQQMIEACSMYRIATLQQMTNLKAVVGMGSTTCEALMGSEKVANFEGTHWISKEPLTRNHVPHVWITYSPAYALQDPSETVGIYRTLFHAAIEAGLKPKLNPQHKHFDYGT